ncbi:MAG: tetratricopeptide repeat protein [Phycisphaerales bacterium]
MADREDLGLILISIGFVVVVGGAAGVFFLRQSMNRATTTAVTPYGRAMPNQNFTGAWTSPEQAKIDRYTDQIEADPSSFGAFLGRAEAHLRTRNYQAALDDYNRAIQIDPSSPEALRGRARVHPILGEHDLALQDITTVVESGAATSGDYASRGNINMQLGNFAEAVTDYDTALDLDPTNISYVQFRAWVALSAGQYEKAVDDYSRMLEINPDEPYARHNRGFAKFQLRDYDGAIKDLRRAVRMSPNNARAHADLARILHADGRLKDAMKQADRAVDLQQISETRGFWVRARLHRDLGRFDAALEDLDSALKWDPKSSFLHRERAWVHWAKGDHEAALAPFTKATEVAPSGMYGHLGLGVMYYHLGRWDDAQASLHRAIEVADEPADYAHFYLYLSHARAGDRAGADALITAYAQDREPIRDGDWPGRIVAFLGTELSEGELLKAAQVPAGQPATERLCEAHFYIGSLQLIEGDRDGAVRAFRQCIEQGATRFFEHHSARSELRALGEDL